MRVVLVNTDLPLDSLTGVAGETLKVPGLAPVQCTALKNSRKKPLKGPFTREQFKEAVWEWLDRYADKIEKGILEQQLKEERLKRLGRPS